MSLFVSSNFSSGGGFTSFEIDDGSTRHHNFVRFLEVASALDVPLLPLTWEPALEALGADGATGHVSQSPFNSQLSLAFKRFTANITRPDLSLEEFRDLQYTAMISEMVLLSSAALRTSTNVTPMIGVCFELYRPTGDVFPVLVFPKAALGDLNRFTSSYADLEPDEKMAICGEIAKGILSVHRCDLKPANVLVFPTPQNDGVEVRIADFGFSSINSGEDQLIKVPRTEPWDAPEWHRNYFKPINAKRMDVYTFGLICVWMFLPEEQLVDSDLRYTVHTLLNPVDDKAIVQFQTFKRDQDKLRDCVIKTVRQNLNCGEALKSEIEQLLGSCLAEDPEKRDSMQGIYDNFWRDGDPDEEQMTRDFEPPSYPDWHGSVQIEKFFFHLEPADFRLHSHIAQSFKQMAEGEGCTTCRDNAAFQLALCHAFGFGVVMDEDLSQMWLAQSKRTASELTEALHRIQESNPRANFMAGLSMMGYRSDLVRKYAEDGVFKRAVEDYRRDCTAREKVFGPSHFSTVRVRGILVDLLRQDGQYQEAIEHANKNISSVGDSLPLQDRMTLKTQLANIYRDIGDLKTAESLERETISAREEATPDDPTLLHNQTTLADILVTQGKYQEAIEILEAVHRRAEEKLGAHHATNVEAMRSLAAAYDAEGELEKSIELGRILVKKKEDSNGKDDPRLAEDMSLLGIRLYRLGNMDEALSQYANVKSIVQQEPGRVEFTITAVGNYATALMSRGMLEEAMEILQRLIPESESLLGEENEKTAALWGNLAAAFQHDHRWKEAEALERRVLHVRRKLLGNGAPDTLTALHNLVRSLYHQGKWLESAKLGEEELAIRETVHKTSAPIKLRLLSTLATALAMARQWDTALPYFEKAISFRKTEGLGDSVVTIPELLLAAVCLVHLRRIKDAKRQIEEVLDLLNHPFHVIPTLLFDRLTALASACLEAGYYEEAEEVIQTAVGLVELIPQESLPPNLRAELARLISELPKSEENGSSS